MARHTASLAALSLVFVIAGCGPSAKLEVYSFECKNHFALFWASVTGEVQNISSHSLSNILASVTFRSVHGSVMEAVRTRIRGPLPPGATSRFEVGTMASPGFSTCEVAFTDDRGLTIPHLGGWFELERRR